MMQRIKQANHDRDEALLRAKALTENAQKYLYTMLFYFFVSSCLYVF